MRIVLGVSGGIAAYKAAEIARAAHPERSRSAGGADACRRRVHPSPHVRVAHRPQGHHGSVFVRRARKPLSPVRSSISASRRSTICCSSRPPPPMCSAKFAQGLADDFLSTMYLAFRGPVVLAPAMNNNMWEHEPSAPTSKRCAGAGTRSSIPTTGFWLAAPRSRPAGGD